MSSAAERANRLVTNEEDVTLMTAVAGGDRECLGRLYDRYAPVLIAVGIKMLGNRREAEDLVHDVFLEVWRQSGDYDESRGSVRTSLLITPSRSSMVRPA